jgi:hypothetical protein
MAARDPKGQSTMGRLGLSFKAFFRILSDGAFAEGVQRLAEGRALPEAPAKTVPAAAPVPARAPAAAAARPARSEALTLLAVLQREARLVDFLKEDIGAYSNEQVGAAVRDVHRDAAGVLDRLFALAPVMAESEGAGVQVPGGGGDAARVRLVGNVAGQPPYRGTLRHAGWEATKVQLPDWSGAESSARVVAPAEVEL